MKHRPNRNIPDFSRQPASNKAAAPGTSGAQDATAKPAAPKRGPQPTVKPQSTNAKSGGRRGG